MAHVDVTGPDRSVESDVGSFVANLPEMLGAMAVDPRCLVAVVEFADDRYVQFWVESIGQVISEVISNINIGDAVALDDEDEELLRAMGWGEPSPGANPNWRFESHDVAGLIRAVEMVRGAVYEVLRERPDNTLTVRSWSVRRDGRSTEQLREETRVQYRNSLREIRRELDDGV